MFISPEVNKKLFVSKVATNNNNNKQTTHFTPLDTQPGCYPPEVADSLTLSLVPFEESVTLANSCQLIQLLGRALNLGYACYLLGRFGDSGVPAGESECHRKQSGAQCVTHELAFCKYWFQPHLCECSSTSSMTPDGRLQTECHPVSCLGDVSHQATAATLSNCYFKLSSSCQLFSGSVSSSDKINSSCVVCSFYSQSLADLSSGTLVQSS